MAKNTLPANAGEQRAAASDKKEYRVKPGVPWINGKRVGNAKTVALTAAEAAYDLGLDRIAPADKPEPASWAKKADKAGQNDG